MANMRAGEAHRFTISFKDQDEINLGGQKIASIVDLVFVELVRGRGVLPAVSAQAITTDGKAVTVWIAAPEGSGGTQFNVVAKVLTDSSPTPTPLKAEMPLDVLN